MLICPSCRSEYVSGITRCNGCDTDLVPPDELEGHELASSPRDALKDVPTVSIAGSTVASCREVERMLLSAGILAYVDASHEEGAPLSAGTVQYVVVIAREDAERAAKVLEGRFLDLVEKEGTGALVTEAVDLEADEVTCPACGHTGPLDDEGACADCGLGLGVPG